MKKFVIFLFFLSSISFSTFAIPKDPLQAKEKACCEKPPVGLFAFAYKKDNGVECPQDFHFYADFLWLRQGSDMVYVLALEGEAQSVRPRHFRPGFRIGIDAFINTIGFKFAVAWTYIRMKDVSEVDRGNSNVLTGSFLPPSDLNLMPHASTRWSGDLNFLDVNINKSYHVSRYYIATPTFGIRASFIDQDFHYRYFNSNQKNNVFLKNDSWGVGLRSAYNSKFLAGKNFSIYANGAYSLLLGKFDISQKSNNIVTTLQYKTEDVFYNVQSITEIQMGINCSKFLKKKRYLFSLKVGYEFYYLRHQNQARYFFDTDPTANDVISRGNLNFNGFVFGLSLEF